MQQNYSTSFAEDKVIIRILAAADHGVPLPRGAVFLCAALDDPSLAQPAADGKGRTKEKQAGTKPGENGKVHVEKRRAFLYNKTEVKQQVTGHHELRCAVHPFGSLSPLRFVVVCSFYEGRMLLSYHSGHRSWETQGGHIEQGETPEEAARRELYEESGVDDAEMIPVCDYSAYDSEGSSNGRVYAAVIRTLGQLPPNEMSRVQAFESFPDHLTYPFVTPVLFQEARKRLRKGQGA